MAIGDFSIVHAPFVNSLGVVAIGSVVASIGWRARRPKPEHRRGLVDRLRHRHPADAAADPDAPHHHHAADPQQADAAAPMDPPDPSDVTVEPVLTVEPVATVEPADPPAGGFRGWFRGMLPPAAPWRLQLFVGVPVAAVLVGLSRPSSSTA